MAFPADISGFTVNKVRVSTGDTISNGFQKGNMCLGISYDYGAYDESCYTGWYQGMWSATGSTIFDRKIIYGRKDPGGSLFFRDNSVDGILIGDASDTLLIGAQKFTLEFWFKHNTGTTANTQYYLFGNVTSADTIGLVFLYDPANSILTVRAGETSNWDIFTFTSSTNSTDWHHVCLERNIKDTLVLLVDGQKKGSLNSNTQSITSPDKKYSIGIPIDESTNFYDRGRCYITNLRFLFGMGKYDDNGFTVPPYPISAIGKSTGPVNSKLMLNVRQISSYLNNSGLSSFTFSAATSYPIWSTESPFLYDIPSIFVTKSDQDVINIVTSNFQSTATTYASAIQTINDDNNALIQNFVYPEIRTLGLTHCFDSGHLTSYPYNRQSVSSNNKWYNLVNRVDQNPGIIDSTVTLTGINANTYFITPNNRDAVTISGLSINNNFTLIIFIGMNVEVTNNDIFSFTADTEPSGIYINLQRDTVYYTLNDTSGTGTIFSDSIRISPYSDPDDHTVAIGFDSSSSFAMMLLDDTYNTTSIGNGRDPVVSNVKISSSIDGRLYGCILYDRLLEKEEIDNIRTLFRLRIPNLV